MSCRQFFIAGIAILMASGEPLSADMPPDILKPVGFASLEGWADDDHRAALLTFLRSCKEAVAEGRGFGRAVEFGGKREQWTEICQLARLTDDARHFFETSFMPFEISDPDRPGGLFTGYYEPEVEGNLKPGDGYSVPVYRTPADLVRFDDSEAALAGVRYGRRLGSEPKPYLTRREIEEGALAGRGLEIVWLRDWADAFFVQVQGSGRVRLPDGEILRLAYAAKSGLEYTSIGQVLVDRGVFSRDAMSMQAIRAWMAVNPRAARELMWLNRSYVFFRQSPVIDPALGPPGAQQVLLTPGRSLAVDRNIWAFGTPIWLETAIPGMSGPSGTTLQRLFVAQDTGSAIKGYARGDIFFGSGNEAAWRAGHMKGTGRMVVLLPRTIAAGLGYPE